MPLMFPSSDSEVNPFPFPEQARFHSPFINYAIPNSKHQYPSLLFHIPPLFDDYHDDNGSKDETGVFQHHHEQPVGHLLLQQQQVLTANKSVTETVFNMAAPNTGTAANACTSTITSSGPPHILPSKKKYSMKGQIPRKRSAKKDRHSKIYTAQGPRDRRMRLSLEISRKFFDLQDMLGFDKASKTIEWLLGKSKNAIKELGRGIPQMKHSSSGDARNECYTSQCEVVQISETTNNGEDQQEIVCKGKSLIDHPHKEKKTRQVPKAVFRPLARESRAKARQRARERTREKMSFMKPDDTKRCRNGHHHDMIQFSSSSPLETGVKSVSPCCNMTDFMELPAKVHGRDIQASKEENQAPTNYNVGESFAIMREPQPSSIYNYQHNITLSQGLSSCNNFPDLIESWETDGTRKLSSYCDMVSNAHLQPLPGSMFPSTSDTQLQSQFAEFQLYGKP